MEKIRITQSNIEIEYSDLIFNYFNMMGIYVQRRFYEDNVIIINKMIKTIKNKNAFLESFKPNNDFDLELYLVDKVEQLEDLEEYNNSENVIIIAKNINLYEKIIEQYPKLLSVESILNCDCEQIDFFYNINKCIKKMGLINRGTFKYFNICADIYVNNDINKLFLSTSETPYLENDIEKYKVKYDKIVNDCCEESQRNNAEFNDLDSINLHYALLYTATEANILCLRCNQPLLYTGESLIDCINIMLDSASIKMVFSKSLYTLSGRIKEQILSGESIIDASYDYKAGLSDYNSYSLLRFGNFLAKENSENAIKYFSSSLLIDIMNYKAWYLFALSCVREEDWQNALYALLNVEIILTPRLETDNLRPVEFEYLFKAESIRAFINNKKAKSIERSIDANLIAEKVWNSIDTSNIYKTMEDSEQRKKILKKELHIKYIYNELGKLYDRTNDKERSTKYYLKSM